MGSTIPETVKFKSHTSHNRAAIKQQQGKFGLFRTWCWTIGYPYGHKVKIDPGDRINSRWLRTLNVKRKHLKKTVKKQIFMTSEEGKIFIKERLTDLESLNTPKDAAEETAKE